MIDWWASNGPPVYMAVATYLGLSKPGEKDYGDLEELAASFGELGGFIS